MAGEPEKIHLIPDDYRILEVGRLSDGRLFWVDGQLDSDGRNTRDFVCTFIFNDDGTLVDRMIELIGVRGAYPNDAVHVSANRQLEALGNRSPSDIWVRPFSVDSDGATFGLIPRQTPGGEWRVTFMPGNTLEFYPPWNEGGYDT